MKNVITTNEIRTATYVSNGKQIKVHAIQTGLISVKENFLYRKGRGVMSKLNIVFGNSYAPFMPIWAWAIEHPEGVIVIDTGDIEESRYRDFYKNESTGTRLKLKAMSNIRKISKEDELDSQLLRVGIKPEQVSKVVLTHLHGDHTDGLKFFRGNEIVVNESERKNPYGNLATTYPKWFSPSLVNFSKDRADVFDVAYPLTQSEDVLLVPTPGHTHHHSSVLLRTDHEHILFAGDVSYKRHQLLDNKFAGSNVDFAASQKTYDTILNYAKRYPLIYLPSHDENAANMLSERAGLLKVA